jgi:MYXO-CTERM domain-containing protein
MEVMDWLDTNGYAQDPAAEPILAEYLAENYLFAAFKLTNSGEVAQVHPIVLRFDVDEACVPLRLTRIAAQDDMEVRTFFLADDRVVPQTYKHVLVNPLKLDWPSSATNYKEIITLAVDAFGADGKAFVTEYSGPSDIVFPQGIYSPSWNPQAFVGLDPVLVIDTLQEQGVPSSQPMLLPLLSQYLPVPVGLTPQEFYNCLSCYADQIDAVAWGDGSGFAMDMQDLIVLPGQHAVDLLGEFPQLTRMYTTISPAEMTADPFFWENPDLPDVDLSFQIATRRVFCNQDELWTLPDGREVYLPQGSSWPAFDDEMPYVEEIEDTPIMGPPIGLVDNSALIDEKLFEYNCSHLWPTPTACGQPPGGTGTGGGEAGEAGEAGESGTSADEGGASGGGGLEDPNGCGCTSGEGRGALALFAFVLASATRRRRRE